MIYLKTEQRFERTDSGKSWRAKPYSTTTELINETNYHRTTSDETQRFFRRIGGGEHAERSYTKAGYIVTRLTSTNPSKDEKIARHFEPLARGITHKVTHKKTGATAYTYKENKTAGEMVHRVAAGTLPDRIVAIPTATAARLGYKMEKLEIL